MARRRDRYAAGTSRCGAHRNRGSRSLSALDMDTLGIGPTDLGSLSISHPYTDAPGMTPTLVHGPILHASRLPGRHEKTRLLPLTKATRTHAAHPAGQVVKTGKGLTFSLGDDACRHGWPDAAQGLQLFGRGTVGVDGGDGIRNVSGHHHGGWRSIRGQIRRPCRSTACQQPRKQQKRRQKRPEDGNEPGKSARGWRQGGPCPEDGLHGELPVCRAIRADAAGQRERA